MSFGRLKTPSFYNSSNLFWRSTSLLGAYWGRRPFLCGGSTGPMFTLASKGPLGSWDQKRSQSHLGGSEMTTAYRAVKDCLGQSDSWWEAGIRCRRRQVDWLLREVGSVLKTGLTWQKCSCLLSLTDKFGIGILPATLEIMPWGSHSSEVVTRWTWGMSERDSKAWSESEGRPCGSSNST